ncbi:DUF6683 family protein [Thiolapillus sp.]
MLLPVKLLLAALSLMLIAQTHAGISPENLPSMDNLAALLEGTDQKEVKRATKANNGRIASGLPVRGDSAHGATASQIAALLSDGDKNRERQLSKAIMEEREAFEQVLAQHGFDTRDMGVAFAASFITLWELASHKQLPLEGSLSAGEFLTYAMQGMKPEYNTISAQEKEQGYDWLMTTPVAFASLVKGFEKAGRQQEAEQLRSKSAALFKEIFRLPHDSIIITTKGAIEVDTDRLLNYDNAGASSDANTLIDQALNLENNK